MSGIDFLERVKDYLESKNIFSSISLANLTDGDSICIRPTPTPGIEKYIDKNGNYDYGFQILCRNRDNYLSYSTLLDISLYLDGIEPSEIISQNDSFTLNYIDISTSNNFIEVDNYGWIYSCLFNANLYLKKGG